MSDTGAETGDRIGVLGRPPLSGLRLIDFTFQAAGAYASMLLAGLGAEVVKVESALRPDPTRGRIKGRPYQHSVFYEDVNLGKLSITVNLKRPEGVQIIRRLIECSDAVVENFRPGVLARLGLSPDSMLAENPRLVVGSLTAVGSSGPLGGLPGYAGVFNALGGLGTITGYAGGPPTELRTSVDMRAGALFAVAIVAALVGARRSGRGSRIDFSAGEAVAMLCGDSLAEYSLAGMLPERIGNSDSSYCPHQVYSCRDGWIFIAVRNDTEWTTLARLMARDGITVDASLDDVRSRLADRAAVDALVSQWVKDVDRRDLFELLQNNGIPAGPAFTGKDIMDDRNLAFRRFVGQAPVVTTDTARAVCEMPWLVAGQRPCVPRAPALGKDTKKVLEEVLGMTASEIEHLADSGAIV